jgi:hypothetical protein
MAPARQGRNGRTFSLFVTTNNQGTTHVLELGGSTYENRLDDRSS